MIRIVQLWVELKNLYYYFLNPTDLKVWANMRERILTTGILGLFIVISLKVLCHVIHVSHVKNENIDLELGLINL